MGPLVGYKSEVLVSLGKRKHFVLKHGRTSEELYFGRSVDWSMLLKNETKNSNPLVKSC